MGPQINWSLELDEFDLDERLCGKLIRMWVFVDLSTYCYADSLPHPVTLQTAYANTRHSPDIYIDELCGISLTVAPTKLRCDCDR